MSSVPPQQPVAPPQPPPQPAPVVAPPPPPQPVVAPPPPPPPVVAPPPPPQPQPPPVVIPPPPPPPPVVVPQIDKVPVDNRDVLSDLETLEQLKYFQIKLGDVHIFHACAHSYSNMQEILDDMIELTQPMNRDALIQRIWMYNSPHTKGWADSVADKVIESSTAMYMTLHVSLARILDKMTPNARKRLRMGFGIQDTIDEWNLAVQRRNYAYYPRPHPVKVTILV